MKKKKKESRDKVYNLYSQGFGRCHYDEGSFCWYIVERREKRKKKDEIGNELGWWKVCSFKLQK